MRWTWFLALGWVACGDGSDGKGGAAGSAGSGGANGQAGLDGAAGIDGETGDVDSDGDGITLERDCDDTDPSVGAPRTVYLDLDRDGFGHPDVQNYVCGAVSGWVDVGGDCDDLDATVHPDNPEVCDGLDNDCDGRVDADDDSWDPEASGIDVYVDADGDGYGDPERGTWACEVSTGFSALGTDCDDGDPAIHPDAVEICGDGVDDNCDGGAAECLLVGDYIASDANVTLTSSDDGSQAGFSLAAPDLTGDGLPDLVVGTPFADTTLDDGVGAIYVHYGSTSLGDGAVEDGVEVGGLVTADYGGYAVAAPGDVDGDGYDDLWVGDPGADKAYLFYGGTTAWTDGTLADLADFTLTDGGTGYLLGYGAVSVGDLNGDGYADLAAGEYKGGGSFEGAVYLVYGSASLGTTRAVEDADATFVGAEASDYAGVESASVTSGDFDGDGLLDLVIGAPGHDGADSNMGQTYVLWGTPTGWSAEMSLDDADVSISATSTDGSSLSQGADVRRLHDFDGDGLDDLAVAAYLYDSSASNAGSVFVFMGNTSAWESMDDTEAEYVLHGGAADDQFGRSLGRAQDVDGDGFGDLLVAAQGVDAGGVSSVGATYLFRGSAGASGTVSASDADATVVGETANERLGIDALTADLDGNGSQDLVLGASGSAEVRIFQGAGY